MCVYGMVYNALRWIPKNERLEVVLEAQDTYGFFALAALATIKDSDEPDLLNDDGRPKLANFRFVDKESTILTEPADFLANTHYHAWKDAKSLRSKWFRPLFEAEKDRTIGHIWTRDEYREIVSDKPLSNFIHPAVRALVEAARGAMGEEEFRLFAATLKAILKGKQKELDKLKKGNPRYENTTKQSGVQPFYGSDAANCQGVQGGDAKAD